MNELTLLDKLFSEFGIIATLFVIVIFGMIYLFVKIVRMTPFWVEKHFTSIEKQNQISVDSMEKMNAENNKTNREALESFTNSLTKITGENKVITSTLLKQFEKQSEDHEKMIHVLDKFGVKIDKIDRTQDMIHGKIK